MPDTAYINVDQLRVGLYVDLELKWFDHPFAFSRFKIKSEEQIRTIRSLGLKSVRYAPALSDASASLPGTRQEAAPPVTVVAETATDAAANLAPALAAKSRLVERIRAQREVAARIESAFIDTATTIHDIEKNLFSQPAKTVQQATQLITQITDTILCAPELAIHVMGDKMGGEELYFHSLNVTLLSIMVARNLALPPQVINALGLGALLHDIGFVDVPNRILLKTQPLTPPEQHLYEMHCDYGVEAGRHLQLPPTVLTIIREHHEMFDGSGYPQDLQGEDINLLSRIVAITNYYDELCNPVNIANALTPHEALSLMFAKLRSKFDPRLLQVFIRCLGVYPPGTIVQLSNGVIGMVATVNTERPMKPVLVIYDPDVPKDEAILVDMECETDLNIVKAIKPAQVPQNIYFYLSPRKRVSYYFDANNHGQGPTSP